VVTDFSRTRRNAAATETRSAGGGDSGDGGDDGDGGEPRRRRQSRTDDGRAMNH